MPKLVFSFFQYLIFSVHLQTSIQFEPNELLIISTDWGERSITGRDVAAYEFYNQAVQAGRNGHFQEAIEFYVRTLKEKPDIPEALINYSNLLGLDDLNKSRELLELAVTVADHPSLLAISLSNLGHLKQRQGGKSLQLASESEALYIEALKVDPKFVDALFNYGTLLELLGRVEEAALQYQRVLEIEPQHSTASLNLANCFFYRKNTVKAIEILQKAASDAKSLKDRLSTLNNLGQVYRDAGDHVAAFKVFSQALEESPGHHLSTTNVLQSMRSLCFWENIGGVQDEIIHLKNEYLLPYDALFIPDISLQRQQFIANDHAFPWKSAGPSRCDQKSVETGRYSQRQLTVMYLSFDFRRHPMGYLTQGLLSSHNRHRFHVSAVSYGLKDNSEPRRRIQQSVDTWLDVHGAANVASTTLMREQTPDVIIDLMGFTRGSRNGLAASRPAPILINYLGFPSSMGDVYCDYAMVDSVSVPPEAAKGFAEKLIYLPRSYQANSYPLDSNFCSRHLDDEVSSVVPNPCLERSRSEMLMNITSDQLVICNFNNHDKMEPVSFGVWMHVMREVPNALLVMLYSDMFAESNLKSEAASLGVHPSRLLFLKHVGLGEHLSRLSGCDLVLDNFIYGAHTTASDALWSAVPLVSLRGLGGGGDVHGRMQSRVGASLLSAVGLEPLATHSIKEFTHVACLLAQSEVIRIGIRRKLSSSMLRDTLFDTSTITADIERGYYGVVEARRWSGCEHLMHLVVTQATQGAHMEKLAQSALLQAVEKGEIGRALIISERLLCGNPVNADAWHLRGLALFQNGHHSFSAASIRRALGLYPNTAFYWANLAATQRVNDEEAAISSLLISILLDPIDLSHVFALRSLLEDAEVVRLLNSLFQLYYRRDQWPEEKQRSLAYMYLGMAIGSGDNNAVIALREAVHLDPSNHLARLKLGAALEAVGEVDRALDVWLEAVQLEHEDEFNLEPFRVKVHPPESKVLAIYCHEYGQSWWPNWGPRSLASGLGGSEEAVVFLSREMAQIGYIVEVYANPPASDIGRDEFGVYWYPHSAYDVLRPPTVFVAWRYHISAALALHTTAKVFIWLQDVPSFKTFMPWFIESISGVFCLSAFHVKQLPEHAQSKALVTPNGIDPMFFVDGTNGPTSFVYGSAPNRGLETVLRAWPHIRKHIPDASLNVFYGFSNSFMRYGRNTIPNFDNWLAQMNVLLEQPGVNMIGMVEHMRLADGFGAAGFILYPTTYPETGCVTLMKAMAMGAIPITSRFEDSTLPELTDRFDLSGQILTLKEGEDYGQWVKEWIASIVNASHLDSNGALKAHRNEMKTYARTNFLWSSVARLWNHEFSSHLA